MSHHPTACLWIWNLCMEIRELSCGSTADMQSVEHILWSTATSLIELAQVLGADGCMHKVHPASASDVSTEIQFTHSGLPGILDLHELHHAPSRLLLSRLGSFCSSCLSLPVPCCPVPHLLASAPLALLDSCCALLPKLCWALLSGLCRWPLMCQTNQLLLLLLLLVVGHVCNS